MRRFMVRYAVLLMLSALLPVGYAQEVGVEKVHLLYLTPAAMMTVLKNVKGLTPLQSIIAVDSENAMVLTGSGAALLKFNEAIRERDVAPRQLSLKMRLLQISVSADGARKEETLQAPIITTVDNVHASVAVEDRKEGKVVSGDRVEVLPHLEKEGMVTLSVTVRKLGVGARSVTVKRRVRLGETVLVTGFTDSKDKAVREAVRRGVVLEKSGAFVAQMLEVTPTEIIPKTTGTP